MKRGFTLAEVLITLVIIGIIAAITVPGLINKTNNQEYVSKLKKAYSVLQQSIHKIALDNGYSQGDYSFATDINPFINNLVKTAAVARLCTNSNDCFGTENKRLNGYSLNIDYSYTSSFVTNDGMVYTFATEISDSYFNIPEEDIPKYIGRFAVDINGRKKPNKAGRDIFFFVLINGKGVLPAGYNTNSEDCKITGSGFTCAAKIIKENTMNY